jgi:26S proteasome regulatory subunit N3
MEDVVMTDVKQEETKENFLYQEYRKALVNIDKALSLKDTKALYLLFRQLNRYRKEFKDEDISYLVDNFIRQKYDIVPIPALDSSVKESVSKRFSLQDKAISKIREVPEFFVFNFLIVITRLLDNKQYSQVFRGLSFLTEYLKKNESTTISYLKSKTYYYLSLSAERSGVYSEIINDLIAAYRKACLDLDELTQVTLINCIVRYYLLNNAVDQARTFLSKIKYHENVSTYEDSRYLFYLGRINTLQMNYSEAFKHLTNSIRKAPEKCANGFKTIVQKLLIICELLMGEVPDISTLFNNTDTDVRLLKPYLQLIKAVKQGNLDEFKAVLSSYEGVFAKDGNYTLIQRLRHVVIKIGLRKINLSYSRISLKDITEKLKLESEKETEYIIAKAIRDGVFLAKINHDEGFIQSMVYFY